MINLFITEALASSEVAAVQGTSMLSNLMPIALIMIVFYFLLLRPQQKKMKAHQSMIKSLEKGNVVVFSGGIIGNIIKNYDEHVLLVEIASNVRIKIRRDSVTELINDENVKKIVAVEETEKKSKK